MTRMLLEGGRLPGVPEAVDVLIADGVVAEVVPHGAPIAAVVVASGHRPSR